MGDKGKDAAQIDSRADQPGKAEVRSSLWDKPPKAPTKPSLKVSGKNISIDVTDKEKARDAPPAAPRGGKIKDFRIMNDSRRSESDKGSQIQENVDLDSPIEPEYNKRSPRAQDQKS